jgi:hypothetical protein
VITGKTLIVVARALHIMGSVVWAGFVIVIAAAIVSTRAAGAHRTHAA